MTTRYAMPDQYVAKPEGGFEPFDWRKYGQLDLEPDDDTEPVLFPPEVAAILGFNPLEEPPGTIDGLTKEEKT